MKNEGLSPHPKFATLFYLFVFFNKNYTKLGAVPYEKVACFRVYLYVRYDEDIDVGDEVGGLCCGPGDRAGDALPGQQDQVHPQAAPVQALRRRLSQRQGGDQGTLRRRCIPHR